MLRSSRQNISYSEIFIIVLNVHKYLIKNKIENKSDEINDASLMFWSKNVFCHQFFLTNYFTFSKSCANKIIDCMKFNTGL